MKTQPSYDANPIQNQTSIQSDKHTKNQSFSKPPLKGSEQNLNTNR